MAGSVFPQIARLHHFFPFFSTLISSAHRFPGNPLRIVDVFRRSLNSLLMYQIDIAQARLLMGIQLKQFCLDGKLVSSSDSIVARIE